MDSKNELKRTTSSQTNDYPYINKPIWSYPPLLSDSNHSNGILTIADINNHLNQPFDPSTGEWRILGLKSDVSFTQEVILRFGFGVDTENSRVSSACGFTLGIPPLHARHISTITRSIAYGFIVNAIAPDNPQERVLFIQHENSLINLGKDWSIAELEIQVKSNKVIYNSGGQTVFEADFSFPTAILYVVGAIKFPSNKIINISLSGGTLHNIQTPDYTSEIYVPCLGLGSGRTNIELKLNSTATITYPNNSTFTLLSNPSNWQSISTNIFNKDVPFTLKIKVNNGLSNLTGIKVIDPLSGFDGNNESIQAMTETSLSRIETRAALTEIKEIEIKGSRSDRCFLYHIGELPLPELPPSNPSKIESVYMEGSFDAATLPNLAKHQQIRKLYLTQYIQSTTPNLVNPLCSTRLEKIELSLEVARKLQQNSLINFRRLFNPNRTTENCGFRIHRQDRRFTWFASAGQESIRPFREWQNIREIAIASESAKLLYGNSWVASSSNRNGDYIELSGETAPSVELFELNQQGSSSERGRNITSSFLLFNSDDIIPGVTPQQTYGTDQPNNRLIRSTYIQSISLNSITILSNSNNFTFVNNGYLFIGRSINGFRLSLNPGQHLFRRITNTSTTSVNIPLSNTRVNSPDTRTIQFTQYILTLASARNTLVLTGRTINSNSLNQPNTFTVSIPSNEINNIFIGDTVWQDSSDNPFTADFDQLNTNEYPATVIDKQGNILTLLQGENNKHPQLRTGENQTLRFAYEFSKPPQPLSSQFIDDLSINNPYADQISSTRTNDIRININDSALQMYLRSYTN